MHVSKRDYERLTCLADFRVIGYSEFIVVRAPKSR